MAKVYNLSIDQGADYSIPMTVIDDDGYARDLSDCNAYAQIKKTYNSVANIEFITTITANTGEIKLSLTHDTTANIKAGRYVYDVLLEYPDLTYDRIIEGIITIYPGVSKKK